MNLADVDGSLDALLGVLESYDCEDRCLLNIVDCGIGDINEGDIERAAIGQGKLKSLQGLIPVSTDFCQF